MTSRLRVAAAATVVVASYGLLTAVDPGTGRANPVPPLPYDLNGDGYADVVVGAPGESVGSAYLAAGMFHVLYGSASGATGRGSLAIHQGTVGVPGTPEYLDHFGESNVSGDFNGDGYADVAVSAPGENSGRGGVWVFYGSAKGLRTKGVKTIGPADTTLPDRYAAFGHGLAAGDFNGDGRDDLAISSLVLGPGHVSVFHGTPSGFRHAGDFSQDTPGVPGANHDGDWFGLSLVAGDINGDSRDDLAVGAPLDAEDRGWKSGSVTVFYAGSGGLTGAGAQRWTKDSPGVPGDTGSFDDDTGDSADFFGWRLALADVSGDGRADLAVGAFGAAVTVAGVRKRDAGTVTVLYSDGSRIGTGKAIEVTQQTPGMPSVAGQRDRLGTALAAGDANGDGIAELAAYSPGDDYVTVIPGGSGGLRYAAAKAWTQDSPGIPDTTEPGDWWGGSLRFGNVKGTGRASLVVGADAEDADRGAVTVIHGTSTGLTGVGAQFFSQNSPGVPGIAEVPDRFGTF